MVTGDAVSDGHGICDAHRAVRRGRAPAPARLDACYFDYFGLNHLGWLREVYSNGEAQLHRLWNDADRLRQVYKVPLFDTVSLKA
jgi:6-phospho-beta-glucosidase